MPHVRRFLILAPVLVAACGVFHQPSPPDSDRPLRVMTYNIHAGHGNLARTAEAIRALSPDIVALQEVDVHWSDRSGFVDQVGALAAALGMNAAFAPIYRIPNDDSSKPPREFGVALLSRHRIVTWRNDTLTRLSTQDSNAVPGPAPGLLEAIVDVNGSQIRVFNTHLDYRADPAVRRRQANEAAAAIARSSTPTILFGDMNATSDAAELAPLFALLHDAWPPDSGSGYTYPADQPTKRIDYVLTSHGFHVLRAFVPPADASDHRPVVIDLAVRRE
jgi:endonuclease/exonuclease/phosphatase family metal-dependent hydrolase